MLDSADLERFAAAQEQTYAEALSEVRAGHKRGHWIWFIFPQLRGLGYSRMSDYYGIADLDEARRYLAHPLLGPRLQEISAALLKLDARDPYDVMGYVDGLKLRSCMTLFARAGAPGSVYEQVLREFYGGQEDQTTLDMLKRSESG